jgi:3-dehydroquinate synthase
MNAHWQRFSVSFDYPVYFGTNIFDPENRALVDAIRRREPERRHRAAFIVEERVAELWPTLVDRIVAYAAAHANALDLVALPLVVAGGEGSKNDAGAVGRLQRCFHDLALDRQSFVVIVGGGALQDVAGYAAATTHRGLRVVRVPTTVLSQNDSAVGVKNGINAFGKKNFVGTFAPPFAVLDDFRFLRTLERRDRIAGAAEAVKVALVKDAEFFQWLEANARGIEGFDEDAVSEMIRRCAVLHLDHIAQQGDPFELGSSRPLDFGHWAAHKLESLSRFTLRHGEAVSIGIALDSRYSVERGLLPPDRAERILALLDALGLPTWHEAADARRSDGARAVLDGIAEFQEHLGGELTVMMLRDIGQGCEVRDMDGRAVDECLSWLAKRVGDSAASLRQPCGSNDTTASI